LQIFPNLIANDYKLHVVVNGVVTFWLISISENGWRCVVRKLSVLHISCSMHIYVAT
jgi:hypothetical protein